MFFFVEADFFVGEVAGRVRGPGVAEMQIGPDSQAPAAGVEEPAQPASALDMRPSVPQTFEQRLIGVRPYLAEGPLIDASEVIMPPELVGVHVAVKIYAPDSHSAALQSPAVPGQQFPDVLGPPGVLFQQLEVQIDPVNVIIDGQNIGLAAGLLVLLGLGQYHFNRRAALGMREVLGADGPAPAARH